MTTEDGSWYSGPRTWTLRLRYDVLPLSLNDRQHWAGRHRISTQLRDTVRHLTRHAGIPRLDALTVEMHWTPRTRRTRDRDNAVATMKPMIDGLRDYPARHALRNGQRVLIRPAWVGIVADDDPGRVDYGMPIIHPVNPDPFLFERLALVITERTVAP